MIASKIVLTEEGERYAEEGLPERRLFELVKDEYMPIEDAKNELGNAFSIALQWCKKHGIVEIKNGAVVLVKGELPGIVERTESALHDVKGGRDIDDGMLSVLMSRRLVEKARHEHDKKIQDLEGKEINDLTADMIVTGAWKKVKFRAYNVAATGKKIYPGKRQPYVAFLRTVRHKLAELGFQEMSGPLIETEFWNFDALYQAQNHPSRDWTQTYSLKHPKSGDLPDKKIVARVKATHENGWTTGSTGWGYRWSPEKAAKLMPRAHTTSVSARTLAAGPDIPGKYFTLSRCYRPDVIDVTHGVEFNQMEGIVIDKSLTFKNLLGLLKMFAVEFAGAEKVKFFSDYYPFTEPSVQLSAKHPDLGWIEFGGAGMFREELTKPLGVDAHVIAWGLGIDRLAMFKLGINDIRELFSQDLTFMRNAKVI